MRSVLGDNRRNGLFRVLAEDALKSLQRMVRNVKSQHVPFKGQLVLLLPLGQVRNFRCQRCLRLLVFKACEEIELANGLVALERDHGIDGFFMDHRQSTPVMAE
ncbi:hypothetical protein D3C73_1475090 [compost metagenome]